LPYYNKGILVRFVIWWGGLSSLAWLDPSPFGASGNGLADLGFHEGVIRVAIGNEGMPQQFFCHRSIPRAGSKAFLVQEVVCHS
jgi:hypothetical protein